MFGSELKREDDCGGEVVIVPGVICLSQGRSMITVAVAGLDTWPSSVERSFTRDVQLLSVCALGSSRPARLSESAAIHVYESIEVDLLTMKSMAEIKTLDGVPPPGTVKRAVNPPHRVQRLAGA